MDVDGAGAKYKMASNDTVDDGNCVSRKAFRSPMIFRASTNQAAIKYIRASMSVNGVVRVSFSFNLQQATFD